MKNRLRIAFFGSSLVSAYWNGAATYYRGLVRALHERMLLLIPLLSGLADRMGALRDVKDNRVRAALTLVDQARQQRGRPPGVQLPQGKRP
jgi:hypothetical protein